MPSVPSRFMPVNTLFIAACRPEVKRPTPLPSADADVRAADGDAHPYGVEDQQSGPARSQPGKHLGAMRVYHPKRLFECRW